MMSGCDTLIQPINATELSRYSWREVTGKERDALLQLLVATHKQITLFTQMDTEEEVRQCSAVLEWTAQHSLMILNTTHSVDFDRQLIQQGGMLVVELDEGQLQFGLDDVGKQALPNWQMGLVCRVPEQLLLIQRRGARRVPVVGGVGFESMVLDAAGVERVEVTDLSESGIGLKLHGGDPRFTAGDRLVGGLLSLQGVGRVELEVKIKGVQQLSGTEGEALMVVGGGFAGLSASARALLQRYTFQRDLEQRKRVDTLQNLEHSQVVVGEPVVQERN